MKNNEANKGFTARDFREELKRVLPGYKWTVSSQKYLSGDTLVATGIQSAGTNRMSTLVVERTTENSWYEVSLWGYGTKGPILAETWGLSLRRALRELQQHCEERASTFAAAASRIESARKNK